MQLGSLIQIRIALQNKKMNKRHTLFTQKLRKKTCESKLGVVRFITQLIKRTDESSLPIQNILTVPYAKRVTKFIQLLGIKN